MAKAIATLADVNVLENGGKFTLTAATAIMVSGTVYEKKEIFVFLDGITSFPNAQQVNVAVNTAIKNYATSIGITLADTDILVPKYS